MCSMLLSTPSEGHHYLIDLISGAVVAAICIAIVRGTMRPIKRVSETVARAA